MNAPRTKTRGLALVVSLGLVALDVAAAPVATPVRLDFDGHVLAGYLYRPEGPGPWPALVWNHGSERNPGKGPQFDSIAAEFVPAGYVVFALERRGHGQSGGDYIVDQTRLVARSQGRDAGNRLMIHLLQTEQLRDQLAGLAFLQKLPIVDPKRIVVAGCSFGGIETLLGAESRAGYRAAIALSPGGLTWDQSDYLRSRLIQAVRRMDIPVLILQPAHDVSLGPSRVLGREAASAGTPVTTRVYAETGSKQEQTHCFGGVGGLHVWAEDAKTFFSAQLAN